jgi:hypothetical protein
LNEVFAPNV